MAIGGDPLPHPHRLAASGKTEKGRRFTAVAAEGAAPHHATLEDAGEGVVVLCRDRIEFVLALDVRTLAEAGAGGLAHERLGETEKPRAGRSQLPRNPTPAKKLGTSA